ncbi:tigger transposable element-derived protein 6-like [Uloborus diversus]|uniref:tigger transposable element-derived protein 6-like n=1 Tax=Uloborus diversus TaxID=327109 RepID=UPI002409B285|nr:tigger transposable element-derived protein 6-like [Uloborus diversus]
MEKEKRKVLLFMDQCPAHPRDLPVFDHIKVVFLPANCTSKLQPLDLGIIRCVKVHYKKTLIRRYLAELESGNSAAGDVKISILDAMNMVCAAWRSISHNTIRNCFKKAGFLFSNELECSDQINENEEDLGTDFDDEKWQIVSDGLVGFNEFVDVDNNLITTELRDIEVIAEEMANGEGDGDLDDDNEDDEAKVPPNHLKALEALDIVRDYLQYNSASDTPFSHLYELEKYVSDIHQQKQKQTSIMDFFERK